MTTATSTPVLHIHIEYEYLTGSQMGLLLGSLDEVYGAFLYPLADSDSDRYGGDTEVHLRVATVFTGNSIDLDLTRGVHDLIASADPTIHIVSSAALALYLTGNVVASLTRKIYEFRFLNRQLEQDDIAADRSRLELDERRIALEALESRNLLRDKHQRLELTRLREEHRLAVERARRETRREDLDLEHRELDLVQSRDVNRSEILRRQNADVELLISTELPELSAADRARLGARLQAKLRAIASVADAPNVHRIEVTPPPRPEPGEELHGTGPAIE